ncbi:head-tail connector protein [Celeribacter sp.]|uniref:head-tail connector protein n=1 Tax=Celeribacter sp. TaxID=1890673 RepID=UPI003A921DCE
MMLMEQSQVPVAALPLDTFKDHLRLGTGFADDAVQDGVIETYLRAAMAAIEGRTAKALLQRDYAYSLGAWRDLGAQVLPVAPVSAITAFVIVDSAGGETLIDPARYMLEQDMHRPRLCASGFVLPSIPVGGKARIAFAAGFGATWDDVPADLAQAVFLLAAHYYEYRHETATDRDVMPFGVAALTDRYRDMRLFGGRGR